MFRQCGIVHVIVVVILFKKYSVFYIRAVLVEFL